MPHRLQTPPIRRSPRRFAGLALAALAVLLPASAGAKVVIAKAGGEQQINIQTFGDQLTPAVASDAQGRYAVAWTGPDEQSRPHVYVRLFDAAGNPRSDEIVVDAEAVPFEEPRTPRLGMTPDGRFAVLWSASHAWVRLYDPQGGALGGRVRCDDVALAAGTAADLALAEDGRFAVAWSGATGSSSIYLRAFGASGQPLELGGRIDAGLPGALDSPRVVASPQGSVVVTYIRQRVPEIARRDDQVLAVHRRELLGAPSDEIPLNTLTQHGFDSAVPAIHPDGGFSVIWRSAAYGFPPDQVGDFQLRARRFSAAGAPVLPEVILPLAADFFDGPALAADRFGNSLVVAAYGLQSRPQGQLFGPDWKPVGASFRVATFEDDFQITPAVAANGDGFVAAWASGSYSFPFPIPVFGQDGWGFGIFAQRLTAPLCAEGSKVLCLGDDGRFELSVDWTTFNAQHGAGRAHPITGDTGAFWFFEGSNLELLTKVLDGTAINGNFWVFTGALSDVDSTLTVRDTETGAQRTYHSVQGQLTSRADTEAFSAVVLSGGPAAGTELGAPFAAPGCTSSSPGGICLAVSHDFDIKVDFVDPRTGEHGRASGIQLTDNTGAFSFFDANNLELVVKVLDGRVVNGAFWVFYGGLSDVEYTITVRDLTTLATRTYTNPHGRLESRADTGAFPAIP